MASKKVHHDAAVGCRVSTKLKAQISRAAREQNVKEAVIIRQALESAVGHLNVRPRRKLV